VGRIPNKKAGSLLWAKPTIDVLQRQAVFTGSHTDTLGGSHDDYDVRLVPAGEISVSLTDDVVTVVDGMVR